MQEKTVLSAVVNNTSLLLFLRKNSWWHLFVWSPEQGTSDRSCSSYLRTKVWKELNSSNKTVVLQNWMCMQSTRYKKTLSGSTQNNQTRESFCELSLLWFVVGVFIFEKLKITNCENRFVSSLWRGELSKRFSRLVILNFPKIKTPTTKHNRRELPRRFSRCDLRESFWELSSVVTCCRCLYFWKTQNNQSWKSFWELSSSKWRSMREERSRNDSLDWLFWVFSPLLWFVVGFFIFGKIVRGSSKFRLERRKRVLISQTQHARWDFIRCFCSVPCWVRSKYENVF